MGHATTLPDRPTELGTVQSMKLLTITILAAAVVTLAPHPASAEMCEGGTEAADCANIPTPPPPPPDPVCVNGFWLESGNLVPCPGTTPPPPPPGCEGGCATESLAATELSPELAAVSDAPPTTEAVAVPVEAVRPTERTVTPVMTVWLTSAELLLGDLRCRR